MTEKRGIDVVCPKCDHSWTYRGKKIELFDKGFDSIYVQCGTCMSMFVVRKDRAGEEW